MASITYITSMCQLSVVNTQSQNETYKVVSLLMHYWKQDYNASAVARRICKLRAGVSRQLLIHNHKNDTKFEIRTLLKQYSKQDYKAAAEARRICEVEEEDDVSDHGSNISTLEKKALKI